MCKYKIISFFIITGVCTLDSDSTEYWDKFMQLVSQLQSLGLFDFMSVFSMTTTIESKVRLST